jgi:hypothetical protein
MPCFVGGQMKALTYNQYLKYQLAQSTFLRIQAYDSAIRTKRLAGDSTASYYIFKEGEQVLYKMGQFILTENNPTNSSLYLSVVKV